MNARHVTVRNVPAKVMAALDREKRRRGTSLNQTVIDLLGQAVGVNGSRQNGLARFAGNWSEAQLREFQKNTAVFEDIDAELWK